MRLKNRVEILELEINQSYQKIGELYTEIDELNSKINQLQSIIKNKSSKIELQRGQIKLQRGQISCLFEKFFALEKYLGVRTVKETAVVIEKIKEESDQPCHCAV